jgi:hypothetical protein
VLKLLEYGERARGVAPRENAPCVEPPQTDVPGLVGALSIARSSSLTFRSNSEDGRRVVGTDGIEESEEGRVFSGASNGLESAFSLSDPSVEAGAGVGANACPCPSVCFGIVARRMKAWSRRTEENDIQIMERISAPSLLMFLGSTCFHIRVESSV